VHAHHATINARTRTDTPAHLDYDKKESVRYNQGTTIMRLQDTLRLLGLALLWSFSFLFVRLSVGAFGPAGVVFFRVLIAAVVLYGYAMFTQQNLQFVTYWRQYMVLGFFQTALPFFLFAIALQDIGASLGAIINATSPMFGLLIAIIIGDEAPRWQRILGIILGMAGVGALVGIDTTHDTWHHWPALLLGLGATISYGIASNYTRRAVRQAPALGMATFSQTFAALIMLPLLWWNQPTAPITPTAIIAVIALGAFATGLAYLLFFRLVVDVGPAASLAVTFLIPLGAMVWGTLFLNEHITLTMILGCVLVFVGTLLTTAQPPRPSTHTP
jgi:drug/metabolite transporter (DMT)-like permease